MKTSVTWLVIFSFIFHPIGTRGDVTDQNYDLSLGTSLRLFESSRSEPPTPIWHIYYPKQMWDHLRTGAEKQIRALIKASKNYNEANKQEFVRLAIDQIKEGLSRYEAFFEGVRQASGHFRYDLLREILQQRKNIYEVKQSLYELRSFFFSPQLRKTFGEVTFASVLQNLEYALSAAASYNEASLQEYIDIVCRYLYSDLESIGKIISSYNFPDLVFDEIAAQKALSNLTLEEMRTHLQKQLDEIDSGRFSDSLILTAQWLVIFPFQTLLAGVAFAILAFTGAIAFVIYFLTGGSAKEVAADM